MNRFVWDLRYPGGPAGGGGDMEGGGFGGGGPLVAPGAYKARLTAGGVTKTESFTVKIDPRIAKDGITVADLAEQTKFALKVRDALAEARQLSQRVRQAHGREARRPGEAAERLGAAGDQERPVRRPDVHRPDVERRPRDRPGGSEGRRERVRAVQRS